MLIVGKIVRILEELKRDKFTRRDAVVQTLEKKPQIIRFEFYDDAIDKLTQVGEGSLVSIEFKIKGNSSNGKVFNNLVAWDVTELVTDMPLPNLD